MPPLDDSIISVILAAGAGSRMKSPERHKVCYPLAGRTVLEHAIDIYERVGIHKHIIVVGALAEQVMQASAGLDYPIFFCYQAVQRGTGHAAKMAANILQSLNYDGSILVVAGDKVFAPEILIRLIETYYEQEADLAFLTADLKDFPSAGRVIFKDGKPLGIVEKFDIARVRAAKALQKVNPNEGTSARTIKRIILSFFDREEKAALAFGNIWEESQKSSPDLEMMKEHISQLQRTVRIGQHEFDPDEIERTARANLSTYLFRARPFYRALEGLSSHNAQNEEYLTDVLHILAPKHNLVEVPVATPEQVMSFNTREELTRIQDYYRRKKIAGE